MNTAADVDLRSTIYPEFPADWQSATDLMESFLLAGALEMQARRRISPGSPFAPGVAERLPAEYQYDTLGHLVKYGPFSDNDRRQPAASIDPVINAAHFEPMMTAGERIGRLPLIGLVWRFTAEVLEASQHLRGRNLELGYSQALTPLSGVILGKHATVLFMAAFQREWYASERPTMLSPIEEQFLEGNGIPGSGGGFLAASGQLYQESIWDTTWRLVERRSPEYYIRTLQHRQDSVLDLLTRGAQRGISGARYVWPGWAQ